MNKQLRIGELLIEAGLLSEAKVQVALQDMSFSPGVYRTGEILTLRGWVRAETIDFFVETLSTPIQLPSRLLLGEYLRLAHLLTPQQVDELLVEQKQCGVRLGSMAVMRGWIAQKTLDFFLVKLFPEHKDESGLGIRVKVTHIPSKSVLSASPSDASEVTEDEDAYEQPEASPDEDIEEDPWVFDHC